MVDIIDWIQANGVGLAIILLAPLLILFGYIGLSLASVYISSPLSHTSLQSYCSVIPRGIYTIFPGYLTLLGVTNAAYSSLFIISACLGSSVSLISLVFWYAEIIPIALIVELIRERLAL